MADELVPLWLRTFDRLLPVATQFILHGTIDDLWPLPVDQAEALIPEQEPNGTDWNLSAPNRDAAATGPEPGPSLHPTSTVDAVWRTLRTAGYRFLLRWDPVTQLLTSHADGDADIAARMFGVDELPIEVTRTRLGELIRGFSDRREHRGAIVIELASRLMTDHSQPNEDDTRFFAACQLSASRAGPARWEAGRTAALLNPVIWVAHRDTDLPAWFLSDTPGLRSLHLQRPDLGSRRAICATFASAAPGWSAGDASQRSRFVETLAEQTDGFSSTDLLRVFPLMADRSLGLDDVTEAVTVHRSGVLENPWKREALRRRLRNSPQSPAGGQFGTDDGVVAESRISDRVLGQSRSVAKVLDVLKRSATGLTAAHKGEASGPRGVLFLAGPTGVGKTELAKAVTELIYGSQDAMIRFDMSEFSSEYAEARLTGAPPGYIGHDAGGELTDAVRNRPFSLVLLDEIDKAHNRILDNFLQILDDGRLTDSHGRTVDFRETLLVFTSNLGVTGHRDTPAGGDLAHPDNSPQVNERIIRDYIDRFFTTELQRPELLNRIGDNVLVLDYIDNETGQRILDRMLAKVVNTVEREQQIVVDLKPVREQLSQRCLADQTLRFGGRGIGNVLEGCLVNPLARALFDDSTRTSVQVTDVYTDEHGIAQLSLT